MIGEPLTIKRTQAYPVDNANEREHATQCVYTEYAYIHNFLACIVSLCACMHTVYNYVTRFNIKKNFHLQKGS